MAIVPNLDGQGIIANGFVGNVDVSYAVPNRSGAGVPVGAALYASELMLDTATAKVYRALATGGSEWVEV